MKLVSGIVDSGFFAQSALSAEVATKDSLGRNISETYLTGVDLTPYQTTAGMTAYLTTGDSAEFMTTAERSDYIPTGVSSEFYTTANTANYISEVPDTYLQNTDLSTEDGKVTAISGIPLSAGGDVPEGVMVESGLEYNAVNEISGYNGSAIAQYGAEKQFIVHDDTLVHLSNSAQYALGVNLSAVAQLLGVDETVLYSGTYNTAIKSIAFSEPLTAFERIMVLWDHMSGMSTIYGTYDANGDAWFQHGGRFVGTGASQCYDFITQWNIAANRLSADFYTDMINIPPTGYAAKNGGYNELMPVKVIGIGRKEV